MDEMRVAAVEAFYSAPRGGVEIGGVFLGVRDEDSLHIQKCCPVNCQYLTGPSFKLSAEDKKGLSGVLESGELSALGWYHSHNRSEIFLSPEDLQLHQEFFPEPWQIALVLRPGHMRPTRAGFFFRDMSGRIQADAPVQEFIIDPPGYGLTATVDAPAAPVITAIVKEEARPAVPETMPEKERWSERWMRLLRPVRRSARPGAAADQPRPELNRRRAARVAGDGLIAFYGGSTDPAGHRVRDISGLGAFVETRFSWFPGSMIDLTLQIGCKGCHNNQPQESIHVRARVARTSAEGMGLRFGFRSPSELRRLLEFLNRWNRESAQALRMDLERYSWFRAAK
jgi:proteasome lid subunit RPN8/RPN11